MTLGEWGEWGHGALVLPLEDSEAATITLLELADPALEATLRFLPAVLHLQLGAALAAYALRDGIVISNAVLTSANVEPLPALYADRTRFPFFALYRKSEAHTGHTLSWDKSTAEWEFAYVLPALMPAPQERLVPILHAVARTIGKALRLGFHPLYEDGAEVLKDAGIMSARLGPVRYERYERMASAAGNNAEQFFRAIVGTIEVVERDVTVDGAFEAMTGGNIAVHELSGDGTTVDDVAMAEALPPPTITSVTPNSGTKAGGTTVAVVGTHYKAPMTLTVGGIDVPATVVSSTALTAVTPEHAAYTTFMAELVVTRTVDGQSARVPAAFTFLTP